MLITLPDTQKIPSVLVSIDLLVVLFIKFD